MWASTSEDSQLLPRDPRDFLEGDVWEVSPEKMLGIQDTAGTVEPKWYQGTLRPRPGTIPMALHLCYPIKMLLVLPRPDT